MTVPPPTEVEADEAGTGHRDPRDAETRRGLDRVPAALDGRFDLTQVLSSVQRPSQAVVLRVKDREARHASADVPLVLKWYHHRFGPDPGVRRILAEGPGAPGGPGGPVAGLLESGTADGHPYDLTLSYGETDLARYRADRPGPLPPALVRAVVEQLHAALVAVHARDIVHRDVTPDNIMVRIQNEDRPELVLIDFGAAVHEPQHDRPRRRDWVGKPLYLAPEAAPHRQAVTPAVDWWSLGMVVAELAGGSHPIDFRGDEEVLTEVATHDPELPLVTDPRLLMLCQGLLTRAPEHRWGGEQVAAWLREESPPVAPRTYGAAPRDLPPRRTLLPFPFMGREITGAEELARLLDVNRLATARLLSRRSRRDELVEWLGQFIDSPGRGSEENERLVALRTELAEPPDARTVTRLINWLGPRLEVSHHGIPLDTLGIRQLAEAVADGDSEARAVLADLLRHELLPLLAERPGGAGLDEVHRRWQEHRAAWRPLTDEILSRGGPRDRGSARARLRRTDTVDALLLRLAHEPGRVTAELTRGAGTVRAGLAAPVDWYTRLAADPDDTLRLLAARLLAGVATDEGRARHTELAEAEAARLLAADRDATLVWLRRLERPAMLGWALLGATLATVPWGFVIGLADVLGRASQQAVVLAWAQALPAAAAVFALELSAAAFIGPPQYHPRRSLAGRLIATSERPARFARSRGLRTLLPSAALLAGVVALGIYAVTVAPWVWPIGTVVALAVWTVHRAVSWRRELSRLRTRRTADRTGRPRGIVPAGPAPLYRTHRPPPRGGDR
ncbi:protein kinase domain-containing protein [Streptomyces atratus]|uniref:protein kinase domain-containing protein n=1 Tax=Streptomyces atratus TaxID=1893 RepID=UPI0021A8496F|nr:protein kinase [Streptomyces atratus]MCT2541731.1 protein kinase [Streptomyces atratus]